MANRSKTASIGWRRCAFIVTCLALAGCTESKPSNFFVLAPLAPESVKTTPAIPGAGLRLAVGPIKLPKHLDRSQIVVHTSDNRIVLREFERWGAPLNDSIVRILMENLSLLVPTDHVVAYPWDRNVPVAFQVTVDMSRLDVLPNGRVLMVARWRVFDYRKRTMLLARKSTLTADAGAGGSEGIAKAISAALADLSRDIAGHLRSLSLLN